MFRIKSNSYSGAFWENSKLLKDINYSLKNLIIGVWQGPEYASEGFFFLKPVKTPGNWNTRCVPTWIPHPARLLLSEGMC